MAASQNNNSKSAAVAGRDAERAGEGAGAMVAGTRMGTVMWTGAQKTEVWGWHLRMRKAR